MATIVTPTRARRPKPIAPDMFERALAVGAVLLMAATLAAVAKGYGQWSHVPWQIWAHLLTIVVALALTPTMLLRPRGDQVHRLLGRVWVIAMIATALISLDVRLTNPGGFSVIHILSAMTLIQVPIIWWSARRHNIARHRRAVRTMVLGALLIAGFFTFPFHRLLGTWLFS